MPNQPNNNNGKTPAQRRSTRLAILAVCLFFGFISGHWHPLHRSTAGDVDGLFEAVFLLPAIILISALVYAFGGGSKRYGRVASYVSMFALAMELGLLSGLFR